MADGAEAGSDDVIALTQLIARMGLSSIESTSDVARLDPPASLAWTNSTPHGILPNEGRILALEYQVDLLRTRHAPTAVRAMEP